MAKTSKKSDLALNGSGTRLNWTPPADSSAPLALGGTHTREFLFRMSTTLDKNYEVLFADNLLEPDNPCLPDIIGNRCALFVITPTVDSLYGGALRTLVRRHSLNVGVLVLPCNEQNKSLDMVDQLCQAALELQLGRRDLLVAMSGGVCSDIVRVAASLIRRGITHLGIPTTLIGQIDAGIGIKGAVNFRGKKSYLGYFYPPEAVLIDPGFLKTLPPHHYRYGFAEIIKMAVIHDAELFDLVEENAQALISSGFQQPRTTARRVLGLAVLGMLEQLKGNLYEDQTYKRLVDMGHTFSPALESAADFTMHHGEAVAVDIALSAAISYRLGLMRRADYKRVLATIASTGLPTFSDLVTYDLCVRALDEVAKHRAGSINLVLPTRIGEAIFLERAEDLPGSVLEASIALLRRNSRVSTRH